MLKLRFIGGYHPAAYPTNIFARFTMLKICKTIALAALFIGSVPAAFAQQDILRANLEANGNVRLTWSATSGATSPGLSLRRRFAGGNFMEIGSFAVARGGAHTDTGASTAGTYEYQLDWESRFDSGSHSNIVRVTVPGRATLTRAMLFHRGGTAGPSVRLQWTSNYPNDAVHRTQCRVTGSGDGGWMAVQFGPAENPTNRDYHGEHDHCPLTPGTSYDFRLSSSSASLGTEHFFSAHQTVLVQWRIDLTLTDGGGGNSVRWTAANPFGDWSAGADLWMRPVATSGVECPVAARGNLNGARVAHTFSTTPAGSGTLTSWGGGGIAAGKYCGQIQRMGEVGGGFSAVEMVTVLPLAPAAPTDVTATRVDNTNIRLTWTAPAGPVTGYQAQISNDPVATPADFTAASTAMPTTASHTFTVSANTRYAFRVAAMNTGGTGPWSAIVIGDSTECTVPDAPRNLVATPRDYKTVRVTWDAPQNNGGCAIDGYRLTQFAGTARAEASVMLGDVMTYDDTGGNGGLATVTGGTAYEYAVRAINIMGESASPAQTAAAVMTPVTPAIAMTAMFESGGVRLTWTPTGFAGGVTLVRVQRAELNTNNQPIGSTAMNLCGSGGGLSAAAENCAGSSYLDDSITRGTAYRYSVAVRGTASGPAGTAATADDNDDITTPNVTAAAAVAQPTTAAEEDTVTLDGSGSVAGPGLTLTAYQWSQVAGPAVAIANAGDVTTTFVVPTSVPAAGATASFQLRVTDSAGTSAMLTSPLQVALTGADDAPTVSARVSTTTANPGNLITLTATGDDVDGENTDIEYAWSCLATVPAEETLDAPTITLPAIATATFTAPDLVDATDATKTARSITISCTVTATSDSESVTSDPPVVITITAAGDATEALDKNILPEVLRNITAPVNRIIFDRIQQRQRADGQWK